MRKNLPITQKNHEFPAHQTLISITDTKGRITYCNADFIEVSGYTQDELLGQPHNLLRHPDMPAEAFRDFWDTIQRGQLWSGVIKNRRKNGDHYWVRANATPMRDGERIVGYLSVRTRPSAQEVAAAESLYAHMNQEAAAGRRIHTLRRGAVQRVDLLGRVLGLLHPGYEGKRNLLLALAFSVPVLAALLQAPWWGVLLLSIVGACTSVFGLARLTLRPVDQVLDVSRQLASGDLSQFVDVPQRGLGRRLMLPVAQLGLSIRTVMADVREDLEQLQAQARDVAEGSRDLASRLEAQATSLEQTAAAMDEINSTVGQTSDLASSGVALARQTTASAQRSQDAMRGMAATMDEITESSQRIGDIVQTIESVAFQTNILALNAAVEAARAGEQGRGFAVVASEVRALAGRTTDLSKEIRSLIHESHTRVAAGSARAQEASSCMDEAMAQVQQVGQVLEQIDSAAREQALGVRQISEAVQHMDHITQQNAAVVSQMDEAAQRMHARASEARNNIRVFRLRSGEHTHAETDAVALRQQSRARMQAAVSLPSALPQVDDAAY